MPRKSISTPEKVAKVLEHVEKLEKKGEFTYAAAELEKLWRGGDGSDTYRSFALRAIDDYEKAKKSFNVLLIARSLIQEDPSGESRYTEPILRSIAMLEIEGKLNIVANFIIDFLVSRETNPIKINEYKKRAAKDYEMAGSWKKAGNLWSDLSSSEENPTIVVQYLTSAAQCYDNGARYEDSSRIWKSLYQLLRVREEEEKLRKPV